MLVRNEILIRYTKNNDPTIQIGRQIWQIRSGLKSAISHRIDSVLYKQLPSVAMGHFRRRYCCPLSTGGVYGN
jgi:hypothetical protein